MQSSVGHQDIESLVRFLTFTSGSLPGGFDWVARLPRKERESFLSRLASCNEQENRIPSERLLEIVMVLLQEPLENAALGFEEASDADPAVEQLAATSWTSVRTLRLDACHDGPWLSLERRRDSVLRLARLRELRLPCSILHAADLRLLTGTLSELVVLECNLHATVGADEAAARLQRLPALRHLAFDVLPDWRFQRRRPPTQTHALALPLSRLLVRLCPRLRVLGCEPSVAPAAARAAYPRHETRICHALDATHAASLAKSDASSRLRHLIVARRMRPEQVAWHSQHAESLCVVGLTAAADWRPLGQLKNLKFVYTIGCDPVGVAVQRRVAAAHGVQLFAVRPSEPQADAFDHFSRSRQPFALTLAPSIPADLSRITSLRFSDAPADYSRLVEVFTAPHLRKIHVTFANLHHCSLLEAAEALNNRNDVAPELQSFEVQVRGMLSLAHRKMLAHFCHVIFLKATKVVKFHMDL